MRRRRPRPALRQRRSVTGCSATPASDSLDGGNGADRLSGGDGATRSPATRRRGARPPSRLPTTTSPAAAGWTPWSCGSTRRRRATSRSTSVPAPRVDRATTRSHSIEGAYVDSAHADVLVGSSGPDSFFSGDGADVEQGLGGDDRFIAGDGDDRHDGGAGSDTIDMSMTYQAVVSLVSGTARSTGTGTDTLLSIENATGSEGDDVLTGDLAANVLQGRRRAGRAPRARRRRRPARRGQRQRARPGRLPRRRSRRRPARRRPARDPADYRDEVDYTGSDVAVVIDLAAGTATGDGSDTLVRVEDVIGSVGNDLISGDPTAPTSSTAAWATTWSTAGPATTSSRAARATTASSAAKASTRRSSTTRRWP